MSPAAAGVVALVIGAALVVVTRRRLPFRRSEQQRVELQATPLG